jgi:hypothetical protein
MEVPEGSRPAQRWIALAYALLLGSVACGQDAAALRPLTDGGFYVRDGKKYECGLYPGGKNDLPKAHRLAGERIAATIRPLDPKTGRPDDSGRIMAAAIGHSNSSLYFLEITNRVKAMIGTGEIHPRFMLQNACFSGRMCPDWAELCAKGVATVNPDTRMVSLNGISTIYADAQVVFLLTSYNGPTRSWAHDKHPELESMKFEQRTQLMKNDMKRILIGLMKHCPNLKMAYIGSDTWRGNSGVEPDTYEEGFAVKALIADQINGDKELACEGDSRKAPWLAWGGYIWEKDPPRTRFVADGVHPTTAGSEFAAERWCQALRANPTTHPWMWQRQADVKK